MSDPNSRDRPGSQLSLFGVDDPQLTTVAVAPPAADPDAGARQAAIDPGRNVVLEASAGTGKTSVLVWRYVNLLKAGVDPANILAMTFTRKAAAEMRERIIRELKAAAARSEFDCARWNDIRDRLADISIGTIDAFCLSLLREFPLEADLDPGFDMADETEVPRLIDEALDRSMRIFAAEARSSPDIALVLAQLGVSRTRLGLAYSVGGAYGASYDHPGLFYTVAATKSVSTVDATKAMLGQIDDLKTEPFTEDELRRAKDELLNSFVFRYDTPEKVLNERASLEFYGYPADFLEKYRAAIEKVTTADLERVAKKYVDRSKLAILVVGNTQQIATGTPGQPGKPLSDLGQVHPVDITIPMPPGMQAGASQQQP